MTQDRGAHSPKVTISNLRGESLAWYNAFTLAERCLAIKESGKRPAHLSCETTEGYLQRWKTELSVEDDTSLFDKRLDVDELTEEDLKSILGESVEDIYSRVSSCPDWIATLVETYNEFSGELPQLTGEPPNNVFSDFNVLVAPLITEGCLRLRKGLRKIAENADALPWDEETIENILISNLSGRLGGILIRTMLLELHVAGLQGHLNSETTEKRYVDFLRYIAQPDVSLTILQEYPVLARQLVIRIDQWVHASLELLQHLVDDWKEILNQFDLVTDFGVLTSLQGGVGDSHNDGRSVHVLTFSSGFRLVYKPRSLGIEVRFQELLLWLNEHGDHPPFRTLKILDCRTHGWAEFVDTFGCNSGEEIKRFYERQGAYLALLYTFQATDFHYENLIAAGENPVLIDLESLFHSVPKSEAGSEAQSLASTVLMDSVLRVGLLPRRIWASHEQKGGLEVSGLGGAKGQMTPHAVPKIEDLKTDTMRFVRKHIELPGSKNRPSLGGNDVDTLNYTEEIVTGFTNMYKLIVERRDEFLSGAGLISTFANVEVRYIARPTRFYVMRLTESYHPDLLRNALERDRFFNNLWLHTKRDKSLERLILSELSDLYRGDVPVFTTSPGSQHLRNSSKQQIDDFFDESGLSLVRRRVEQMHEEDLKQQVWFIRASMTTLAMGEYVEGGKKGPAPANVQKEQKLKHQSKDFLTAGCIVGDRLEELALRGEEDVTWFGIQLVSGKFWTLNPVGMGLYDGLSGIALFLGYLGSVTAEERYTALAERSLVMMRQHYEAIKDKLPASPANWSLPLSAFAESPASAIYVYSHLGTLWGRSELFVEAEELAQLLPPYIEQDKSFDIITGAAGCIGALLSLYRCKPSDATIAVAVQCGEHLLEQAQPEERGIAWADTISEATKPLTGFSHGASGIAWALIELAALSGEQRFRDAALEALAYEQSVFSHKLQNWPDFRELSTPNQIVTDNQTDTEKHMATWCHGAPGIGLSRLAMLEHLNSLDSVGVRTDIDIALRTTLEIGSSGNHSLCHGTLGNLELFLKASQVLDDEALQETTDQIATSILNDVNENSARTGVPLGVETPGLMTGISGIGYQFLRLAAPTQVPSVLLLEPPIHPVHANT